jgi:pyruvate/2-oxoglutarate dehydrogenase complex dihydrolipoamide dehydrogenase (E3) component
MTSRTIVEAKGNPTVENAVISKVDENGKILKGTRKEFSVDLICLAAGLRPFNELCWATGLKMKYFKELGGFVPLHGVSLETTHRGIYVAGDVSGIEEANTAMDEGRLVGVAVAEKLGFIKERDAAVKKSEIKKSLSSLRVGKYGDKRADAKSEMISCFGAIE